jgi:hypothetical protein
MLARNYPNEGPSWQAKVAILDFVGRRMLRFFPKTIEAELV